MPAYFEFYYLYNAEKEIIEIDKYEVFINEAYINDQ